MAEEYGLGVAIWDEGATEEIRLGLTEYTKGGMALRYNESFWGPTYDQGGSTPVDQVKTGESAEIDVFIAEAVLDKFAEIFPAATLIMNGEKKRLEWGGKIGEGFLKYAKPLVIRPLANISSEEGVEDNKDDDVYIIHAIPRAEFELAYQTETERVYKAVFVGVRDKESGKLWGQGDRSITEAGEGGGVEG